MTTTIPRVQPILFICSDAPPLGLALTRATRMITACFAEAQHDFHVAIGMTFALEACIAYRGATKTQPNLWAAYGELQAEGVIGPLFQSILYYVQVWHGPVQATTTGTWMSKPLGACLDGAGPIEDFLGIRPDKKPINPGNTMRNQAIGRIRHELEHGACGPHPELIFAGWWDRAVVPFPGSSPERTVEIATLNKELLWVK